MYQPKPYRERSWAEKFRDAFHGVREGLRGQSSFLVHFFFTAAVIAAAVVLKIRDPIQWCLLLLCITVVLTAEMLNSSLESLARAITDQNDPHIRTALNVGSAAVLLASIGAGIVGAIIFVNGLVGWW